MRGGEDVTTAEALALIRQSNPYVKTDGVLDMAWTRWALANEGEATKLDQFVAGEIPMPSLATKWGRGWAQLISGSSDGAPTSSPAPITVKPVVGAIIVTAANMDVDLLRQAGVTHVAVELNAANAKDFGTARWVGFKKGWFVVSRGNDGDTLANAIALVKADFPDVTFALVDTESHKTDMGGSLAWTNALYAAFRSKFGPNMPLFNITFGRDSSPTVVNHQAFHRYDVTPIWEAYATVDNVNGVTLGVDMTAEKAELEGWTRPHVALGDKSLVADAVELKAGAATGLGGVWLWSPDNGPAQEALRAGVAGALRGALT